MKQVLGLLVPVIVLLLVAVLALRAWGAWYARPSQREVPRWRASLLFSGLVAVSLGLLMFVGIAIYAQASGGLGYNFAPATLWARADFLLCLAALTLAAMGKGRGRGSVMIGALVMLAIWLGLALST